MLQEKIVAQQKSIGEEGRTQFTTAVSENSLLFPALTTCQYHAKMRNLNLPFIGCPSIDILNEENKHSEGNVAEENPSASLCLSPPQEYFPANRTSLVSLFRSAYFSWLKNLKNYRTDSILEFVQYIVTIPIDLSLQREYLLRFIYKKFEEFDSNFLDASHIRSNADFVEYLYDLLELFHMEGALPIDFNFLNSFCYACDISFNGMVPHPDLFSVYLVYAYYALQNINSGSFDAAKSAQSVKDGSSLNNESSTEEKLAFWRRETSPKLFLVDTDRLACEEMDQVILMDKSPMPYSYETLEAILYFLIR